MKRINNFSNVMLLILLLACTSNGGVSSIATSDSTKINFLIGVKGSPSEGNFLIENKKKMPLSIGHSSDLLILNKNTVKVNANHIWKRNDKNSWQDYHVDYPLAEAYQATCINTDQII